MMYRNTWFEINLAAIERNTERIKKMSGKRFIAVVKANAYGCGDRQIAEACRRGGADMFAVSSLDEAIMLRKQGIEEEILVLGTADAEDIPAAIEYNISLAAFSLVWVRKVCAGQPAGLKVHLKVDTGMSRIGFLDLEELAEAKDLLLQSGCLLEGIFTHFACADTDKDMTERQFRRFKEAVEKMDYPFPWIHCENSDAAVSLFDPLSNAVRIGISLYGINAYVPDLEQPVALYSRISLVKTLPAGTTIGYGATYTTQGNEIIATVPIGYADGLERRNAGRSVYVDGLLVPFAGRICMDQCMIRLPEYRPEGTLVEIFGPHISIEKMAAELGTIPHELMCIINDRVTRIYTMDGKPVEEYNLRHGAAGQQVYDHDLG